MTLLLFEVSGETASPSAMVRCVRGHSAVTPTAHMIRSGETTWIGLDPFGGLIAWDGGDRLRLYDFRRTPLNALQPAAVAPEMKANAAGIPEIDLSGRVRSHALVLSALAVAPDGRSLAFVITGVFEPETPVGTPAWLGIFDVDAMSVTEFGAGNGLFAGNHALAYSRDGRLLLVKTPEWGGLDIAVPAEERIFASIDEVITAAETAPGVISLTFRDGAKGTFALPEFGAGQTAALAARLASAPTVAVPPPEVPENPPGQPQAVVRANEEFLSG
ncbi:MAG TPA: hypothetical protein PKA74_20505, partial [Bauldia sp.]|nr:hypothetical protein [Bauldia sp.]